MADMVGSQEVIDRIKLIKDLDSDKEVSALLGLAPADFSNRKRRGTLTPLIVEWAIKEDFNLNSLFSGLRGGIEGSQETAFLKPYKRDVFTMVGNKTPQNWLSDEPIDELLLSDEYGEEVFLVKMAGNSMEPTIRDGAIFSVDYRTTQFASGQIFVVWMPLDGPVIRRVFIDLEKINLRADNQTYPDIILPLNSIPKKDFLLGRVKWVFQFL
jgi:hypothetical protein